MAKRKIVGRLVVATCQYPNGEPPHTFEYVRKTKPQVYCERHKPMDGNVRVERDPVTNEVIGRRLIVEERSTHFTLVTGERVPILGRLRQAGARWLQQLGLPMLGDLHPDEPGPRVIRPGERTTDPERDPFQWVEVERVEGDGLIATTHVIAVDDQGRPKFDPTLMRLLETEEREVQPGGLLSLDAPMYTDEDGNEVTLHDGLSEDDEGAFAVPAPGILPDPSPLPERPALLPNAKRYGLRYAIGQVLVWGLDRVKPLYRDRTEDWKRVHPTEYAREYALMARWVAEEREAALWQDMKDRVSPVPDGEAPGKRGQKTEEHNDQ